MNVLGKQIGSRILSWLTSLITGTPSTLAGFDGAGAATEYTEANYILKDGTRALQPTVDSTAAWQWKDQAGNVDFNYDSTNGRIGIGTNAPVRTLDVRSSDSVCANVQSDGQTDQIVYFTNSRTRSVTNTSGFSYFLKTTVTSRAAFDIVARFTDVTDATRTSRIDFNTASSGTFGTRLSILGDKVGIGTTNPSYKLEVVGDIKGQTLKATTGISIAEGANATMGTATLVAGTATVNTNKITANSRIFLNCQALGTITKPVALGITARTAGVSFTITSMDITDTSTVAWIIMEPG